MLDLYSCTSVGSATLFAIYVAVNRSCRFVDEFTYEDTRVMRYERTGNGKPTLKVSVASSIATGNVLEVRVWRRRPNGIDRTTQYVTKAHPATASREFNGLVRSRSR